MKKLTKKRIHEIAQDILFNSLELYKNRDYYYSDIESMADLDMDTDKNIKEGRKILQLIENEIYKMINQ